MACANRALEWELNWIDTNQHRYDSPMHALAVKGNIEKRYKINQLEKNQFTLNCFEGFSSLSEHDQSLVSAYVNKHGPFELYRLVNQLVGELDISESLALVMFIQRDL